MNEEDLLIFQFGNFLFNNPISIYFSTKCNSEYPKTETKASARTCHQHILIGFDKPIKYLIIFLLGCVFFPINLIRITIIWNRAVKEIKAIQQLAQNRHVCTIILTPFYYHNFLARLMRMYGNYLFQRSFNNKDVCVIDCFAPLTGNRNYFTNNAHLNAIGYKVLFDAVQNALNRRYG
ncbi:MAG: hypothetical protein ACK5NK_10095 [Niabella sp.]